MARRVSLPAPKKDNYTFEEVYMEYSKHLYTSFYALERDHHIAEDLTQETLSLNSKQASN